MERLPKRRDWLEQGGPRWRLTDDEIRLLGESSFFVRDGFVGEALASAARAEIDALAEAEGLRPAGISRGMNYRIEDCIRGDLITWLDPEAAPPGLAQLHAQFDELRAELNQAAYLGLEYFEVQVAQYPGAGAGYDKHVDAFPGSANRRVTAIVYLNDNWQPEHGGVLRAWLPDGAVREVEPISGRLVVFLSDKVPHQVLPTHAPRCAVTAWYRHRSTLV